MTLYLFPNWRMVRLSAKARCQVRNDYLPGFKFEEEKLVYNSAFFLPFAPLTTGDQAKRLVTTAGRALTTHVLKSVRREFPTRVHVDGTASDE